MVEEWTEYLFYRYHHLLGFEKILEITGRFPDVIALRNGEVTRVELESFLEHVKVHYYVFGISDREHPDYAGRWVREGSRWVWKWKDPGRSTHPKYDVVEDPGNYVYLENGRLKRKTLKPFVDVVVCLFGYRHWEAYRRLTFEGVEVIFLSEVLPEMGIDWECPAWKRERSFLDDYRVLV